MHTVIKATAGLSAERSKELLMEQEELARRHFEKWEILIDASVASARALQTIGKIEKRRREIASLLGGGLDVQHEEGAAEEAVELMSNSAVVFAVQVSKKVYGNRFEGRSLPPQPSVEQVKNAFSRPAQQQEIAGRTEPTMRLMLIEDGGSLHWQPVVLDGPQEMPLETYENQDVNNMNREQRVLASRELNKNPDVRKELDYKDMTVYDLLSHGAAMQGKPIDQATWSMLTAKFKEGDEVVWGAVWDGVRSDRVKRHAGRVDQRDRLRFAVWGDVIS